MKQHTRNEEVYDSCHFITKKYNINGYIFIPWIPKVVRTTVGCGISYKIYSSLICTI